jgi:epoxyqueuosine reductase
MKIIEAFQHEFDVVGVMATSHFLKAERACKRDVPDVEYPMTVVVGLAYPMRKIAPAKTHVVPSFYTFGQDYHVVLKNRIKRVMKGFPYSYDFGVDNHPHDERLAAKLAGIGFIGKNQLLINPDYGSYLFLGIVFIDLPFETSYTLEVDDSCGNCTRCIDACPTGALFAGGYAVERCISAYNQSKKPLSDTEIALNSSLFGCDICQIVCPKNVNKGMKIHPEFELTGKERIPIDVLFQSSNAAFKEAYGDMAYAWRGKTVLMRNALTLLWQKNDRSYNALIEASIKNVKATWYKDTARRILKKLEDHDSCDLSDRSGS